MLITDKSELNRFSSCYRVWQGIPSIVRTRGGRIYISFYSGGVTETYGNFAAVIKSDNDKAFGEPIVVAEKPNNYRCFDPVLWIDPLNRLWFIWNVMPGEEVYASICENPDANELKWSEEFYIGRGVMLNKPLVLSSGEWIFPIAFWKKRNFYELRKSGFRPEDIEGSFVYKSSDNGKTFIKLGGADIVDRSFDEHMVYELNNGVLKMLVRTNYGIGASYSYDRGNTWSKGEDSKLGGPCSRFFISRLKSGKILLVNHYKHSGRNNLTALLSDDDGKNFEYSLLLDERRFVSYPDAYEGEDGFIYITYDHERGAYKKSLEEVYDDARELLIAKITEADIMAGELVTKGSYLKGIATKLDRLSSDLADPFEKSDLDALNQAELIIRNEKDNAISKVFELYQINCTAVHNFDWKKLDYLIKNFNDLGSNDPVLLSKVINFIRSAPKQEKEIYPIIDKIKKYIEDNFAEDFTLSNLAEYMKVSVYYLSHLFKSVTGITIIEYRNQLRLTKAKLMLINTNKTIGNIASNVGFSSVAYFTEVFTKSERIPPSEYRKFNKK